MIIPFDIPNQKLQRLANILHVHRYEYNPELPETDNEQKEIYLKRLTIKFWEQLLKEGEQEVAKQNALLSLPSPDLSDIT